MIRIFAALKKLFMRKFISLSAFTIFIALQATAGGPDTTELQWHHKDPELDKIAGVSTNRALELLKDRQSKPVIVAILDSGMDIDHEDLEGNIWVNEDEIPGNGIDDDKNGYIDDIHGWNFLGAADGTNLQYANLEMTRIFRKLVNRFGKTEKSEVAKEDRADYDLFLEVAEKLQKEVQESEGEFMQIAAMKMFYDQADSAMVANIGEGYTVEQIETLETEDEKVQQFKEFVVAMTAQGLDKKEMDGYFEYLEAGVKYHYNPMYVDRDILGDDYENVKESNYGNPDVAAPDDEHGTHVGGLVGAVSSNTIGVEGICRKVKLMALRTVPNGDEFDKDVANSIRYAVDNGARIINMSFGKSYSPQVEAVYEAIRYAEEKGVLLIHAAGNDGANVDKEENFPNARVGKKPASNFMTIGASSQNMNESLPGPFSNYGKKNVDVFAPGVAVFSTMPDDEYKKQDGTSMAAPVTSGVAALILSYFPELTAVQLKKLLMETAYPLGKTKVEVPGSDGKLTPFKKLSKTGGVVNAYRAAKKALEMYP